MVVKTKTLHLKSEYKSLCRRLVHSGSVIFGGYMGYKQIRKDWTYEEIENELQELMKFNQRNREKNKRL